MEQLTAPCRAGADGHESQRIDQIGGGIRRVGDDEEADQRGKDRCSQTGTKPADTGRDKDRRNEEQIGRVLLQDRVEQIADRKAQRHRRRGDPIDPQSRARSRPCKKVHMPKSSRPSRSAPMRGQAPRLKYT